MRKINSRATLGERISELLSDGIPRSRNEISASLDIDEKAAYTTLIRMKDKGMIAQDTTRGHRDYKYKLVRMRPNTVVHGYADAHPLSRLWAMAAAGVENDP